MIRFRALLARIGSKLSREQLRSVRFIYSLKRNGSLNWVDVFHELEDRGHLSGVKSVRQLIARVPKDPGEEQEWMDIVREYTGTTAYAWTLDHLPHLAFHMLRLAVMVAAPVVGVYIASAAIRSEVPVKFRGQFGLSLPWFGIIIHDPTVRYSRLVESQERSEVCTNDEECMQLALSASMLSPDPHTKVGAVIVSPTGRLISSGHNRMPRDIEGFPWTSNGSNLIDTKYGYVVHAIEDAGCGGNMYEGSIVYTTLFPGHRSAQVIARLGIKEVVYHQNLYPDRDFTISGQIILERNQIIYRKFQSGIQ